MSETAAIRAAKKIVKVVNGSFNAHLGETTETHFAALIEAEYAEVKVGWASIETCPTDRSAFLVYCPERQNIYLVYRFENDSDFRVFSSGGRTITERPMYWMPLPTPPKES